jgi:hypothetical protein
MAIESYLPMLSTLLTSREMAHLENSLMKTVVFTLTGAVAGAILGIPHFMNRGKDANLIRYEAALKHAPTINRRTEFGPGWENRIIEYQFENRTQEHAFDNEVASLKQQQENYRESTKHDLIRWIAYDALFGAAAMCAVGIICAAGDWPRYLNAK